MKLSAILRNLNPIVIKGNTDVDVTGVAIDSRKVQPGFLFIAVRGSQMDGHAFIQDAINAGALVVMHNTKIPGEINKNVTYVQLQDTTKAVGLSATEFYGRPAEKMRLVGVTGTNGKTTIATILYRLFQELGYKVGLCSTVCNYINECELPTEHTTPDAITLNALLAQMVEAGCEYAFMECSSHAIVQQRIGGLKFAGGIFTNLTRDHLDYHETFENYRDAKKAFFDQLEADAFAITNVDDKNGYVMVQNTAASVKTYSTYTIADYKGRIIEESLEGMLLDVDGHEVSVHFVGRFNVANLLAVYGTAVMLGEQPEEVLRAMSTLHPVNGRFETIRSPKGFSAIVDYAHTPDALANVLAAINEIMHGRGRVITVCGAGGNRDKGKRPLMAREAVRQSDQLIVTSDNPRFEDPQSIVDDMLAGLDDEQRRQILVIIDRREAIRAAVTLARPDDVILVAGKGHEPYQEIEGVKYHFDDHEVIRAAFGV